MLSSKPVTIGIRRENEARKFEARVPLTPTDIQHMQAVLGDRVRFLIQPAQLRAFADGAYAAVGVTVQEDLSDADIICCIKEVYPEDLIDGKTYLVFAHVIKSQPDNMPILRELLDRQITLIDYECITDAEGRRTVFFGRSAGQTGMFETLRAFGQRLTALGHPCLLQELKPVYEYKRLADAGAHLQQLGDRLQQDPSKLGIIDEPIVFAFAGMGNVGQGAMEIFNLLSPQPTTANDLPNLFDSGQTGLFYCPLHKSDTLYAIGKTYRQYNAAEYAMFPNRYHSRLGELLPYLSVLLNCVFWAPQYPRILPHEMFQKAWQTGTQRLQVVGDLSCDPPAGSVACTVDAGNLYHPIFDYDPVSRAVLPVFQQNAVTVMAIDNLAAGLPYDASTEFSAMLRNYLIELAQADFQAANLRATLPPALFRATVTHQGQLQPQFQYLKSALERYAPVKGVV
jgi:saccharopine dehydrogenase (NAD+, L-lysine forming)